MVDRGSPRIGIADVLIVWAIFAPAGLEILVTYTRTPVHELSISEATLKTSRTSLDLRDRVRAVVLAHEAGIFESDGGAATLS